MRSCKQLISFLRNTSTSYKSEAEIEQAIDWSIWNPVVAGVIQPSITQDDLKMATPKQLDEINYIAKKKFEVENKGL